MPVGEPLTIPSTLGTFLDNPLAFDEFGFTDKTQNVVVRNREIQTRPGLNIIGAAISERVLGNAWLRDLNSTSQLFVGTEKRWWKFNNATQVWTDLSNAVLLTQSSTPITFTYFFQGGKQYLIGCNDKDATKEYELTQANYVSLANAYIARTVTTITNRVMFGNLLVAGARFPNDLAWSASADRTTYPALARNTLADTSDEILLIRPLGRRAGAVLREQSQWLAISQQGSDAAAFEFTLADQQPGPIGPAAGSLGPRGTQVVYFGSDGNLYSFNGIDSSMIYKTQKYVQGRLNFSTRFLTSVAYYPVLREIWVALPLDSDTVPTHLLIYSYETDKVYLQQMPAGIAISSLGIYVAEFETAVNQLPNVAVSALPDVPVSQLGLSGRGQRLLAGTDTVPGKVYSWDGSTDDGAAISNDWRIILPVKPGQEYEFDGVELQFEPTTSVAVTVSVFVGPTYDNLTETILGTITPNSTATGSTVVRSQQTLRGRVVIVKVKALTSLQLRKAEFYAWPRKIAA